MSAFPGSLLPPPPSRNPLRTFSVRRFLRAQLAEEIRTVHSVRGRLRKRREGVEDGTVVLGAAHGRRGRDAAWLRPEARGAVREA
jgi:hypothetical protein